MCGIVALVGPGSVDLERSICAMNDTLRHRGPDDAGFEVFAPQRVALGMRRLSIVDLEGGHQPMSDEAGDHWIVFNGEIYNAGELRTQLQAAGHQFRTDHSDTEVLVHGFEEWGTSLFARLNGMFALAILDRRTGEVTLARDRLGEKPLYIAEVDGGFAIASELKALFALPGVTRALDPVALEQYLSFDFVLGPRTMLQRVSKLPAGHFAVIANGTCRVERYWRLEFHESREDEMSLLRRFDALLDDAVRTRMVADVPVGLLLSGGLDSTTIGYYMRRHSDDVHSFSIAFEDRSYDESEYAALAADHLGTTHHVERVPDERLIEIADDMPGLLDEPMGDPSFFPTYVLSRYVGQHVKVALGGDASDEFLMGYGLYRPLGIMGQLDRLPQAARAGIGAAAGLAAGRAGRYAEVGRVLSSHLDEEPEARTLGLLGAFEGRGRRAIAPELRGQLPATVWESVPRAAFEGPATSANRTLTTYATTYLTEDILVKVDRASMAASLEVRTAFLDPHVIDFLCTVPVDLKRRGRVGKYLLRQLMRGRIPDVLIDRVKRGFEPPFGRWFRGPLAPMLREHLAPGRVRAAGYLDPDMTSRIVEEHLSGRRDASRQLWLLLQFQLWQERWLR